MASIRRNWFWLIGPVALTVGLHLIIGFVFPAIELTSDQAIHDVLKTLWAIEAALTGAVLILLVFAMESFNRLNPIELVLARFHHVVGVYPVFGILFGVLTGTGLALLLTLPANSINTTAMRGLQWFLIVNFALAVAIFVSIGLMVRRVIRYSVQSAVVHLTTEVARDSTRAVAMSEFAAMLREETPTSLAAWPGLSHAFQEIRNRAESSLYRQELKDIELAVGFYSSVTESWSAARVESGVEFNLGEKYPYWPRIAGDLPRESRPLDRTFDDILQLLLSSPESEKTRGYSWLLRWPITRLSLGVNYQEHLLFQQTLELYEAAYANLATRTRFSIAGQITDLWRGPENLMMSVFRIGVSPDDGETSLHSIDYVRQLYDANFGISAMAYSSGHDHGSGQLAASRSTTQNLLWRVDDPNLEHDVQARSSKSLFDRERKLGSLLLLGLAAGEWWNERCSTKAINFLMATTGSSEFAESEDFAQYGDLVEFCEWASRKVEDHEYPPWFWRWVSHSQHTLVVPHTNWLMEPPEMLSLGVLLLLAQMLGQSKIRDRGAGTGLILPESFERVVENVKADLERWKDLEFGDSLARLITSDLKA